MFELDLLVQMKIMIPEELNEQLEQGDSHAFGRLESYLKLQLNRDSDLPAWETTKLQINDAGPYNDAGQWYDPPHKVSDV
jgi:hypothetical protein